MGSRGPAPKPPEQRRRQNKEKREQLPPPLPAPLRPVPEGDWHPRAQTWWLRWASSPQAAVFIETDWLYLEMLLVLVSRFWLISSDPEGPTTLAKDLMVEIRQAQQKLGGTPDDRSRLKWDLSTSAFAVERPSDVDELDKWRKRAGGA